jgi:phage baseplate assembly protein W
VDPRTDYLDFPYRVGGRGRTAETDEEDHLRDLIHQVLFTSPGERVNRPDFGCGVRELVFMPNSEALAAATQFLVLGALTRWLEALITVHAVEVGAHDDVLTVSVRYSSRSTGREHEDDFVAPWRAGAGGGPG